MTKLAKRRPKLPETPRYAVERKRMEKPAKTPHRILHMATNSNWEKNWILTVFSLQDQHPSIQQRHPVFNVVYINYKYNTPEMMNKIELGMKYWEFRENHRIDGHTTHIKISFIQEGTNLIDYLLRDYGFGTNYINDMTNWFDIHLYNFYSPKDLEYAFGKDNWLKMLKEDKVVQRRRISGSVYLPIPYSAEQPEKHAHNVKITIKDLRGKATSSLENFVNTYLPDTEYTPMLATYSKDEKKHMEKQFLTDPMKFIEYSIIEAECLIPTDNKNIQKMNQIRSNLDLKPLNRMAIPMTTGSLVASMLEESIHRYDNRFKLALLKLGILNNDATDKQRNKRVLLLKQYQDALALDIPNKAVSRDKYISTGLSACSIKWFANSSQTDSAIFNGIVQGGRCLNERPDSYYYERGADIDLSSCYGSALRTFHYPVGLPSVLSYSPNEDRMTLGQFISKYENELIDGLYTVIVEGEQSFEQDLIYSTTAKPVDLARPKQDKKIKCSFSMLRKQIVNGIITADILEVIKKVASNQEKKELLALKVKTAIWYADSNHIGDKEEWMKEVFADKGEITMTINQQSKDTRTRKWWNMPMETFSGILVDMRANVKEDNKPLSEALKLIINTTYGDLCSMFFNISNVVLANNITARARVGVWMLAKALGLRQCITDGGHYQVEQIPYFVGFKPSLATFSNMVNWQNNATDRVRGYKKLVDWDTKPVIKELDKLALQHVEEFWLPYELKLPYERVEHKNNYISKAAYFAKGDYCFEYEDGTTLLKCRKTKKDKKHPRKDLLNNMLKGVDDNITELVWQQEEIMTIEFWKQVQLSHGYKKYKKLMPGDNYTKKGLVKLNNGHIHIDDEDMNNTILNRKTKNHGKDIQWFERCVSITDMVDNMLLNKLPRTIK